MTSLLYNLALHTVVAPVLAVWYIPKIIFGAKYRRSFRGKLGRLPDDFNSDSIPFPRVWFHAVSVGEVAALKPVIDCFRKECPDVGIIVSTGTETGQESARDTLSGVDGFLFLPLDFPAFVKRVVDVIKPDLFVLMETELWPNLVRILNLRETPIVLTNGRISDRSFPRYVQFKKLFANTMNSIDVFSMASETDADRIIRMGARSDRVRVSGNTKFDAVSKKPNPEAEAYIRNLLSIPDNAGVIVAGSTHPGENEIVLDAFHTLKRRFDDLLLILVPRHAEKAPRILTAIRERGFPRPFLRSSANNGEKRNRESVIIVDTIGELFTMYSVATAVFVGGSLVPLGGQNILEPASLGKPVVFGPSMEDFRDARDALLRAGAGFEVSNGEELQDKLEELLSDPEKAGALGEKGREEIMSHMGSAQRNADILTLMIKRNR